MKLEADWEVVEKEKAMWGRGAHFVVVVKAEGLFSVVITGT